MANEFRRLAKGVETKMKTGTETIELKKPSTTHQPIIGISEILPT